MSETITIKHVDEGRPWNDMTIYDMTVIRADGKTADVTWFKKGEGKPSVGDQLEGEVYVKGDDLRFRKASGGGFSGGGVRPSGGGKWQPDHERDPQKVARIARSHAITNAVAVLTKNEAFNGAGPDAKKTAITEWAEWIEGQVNAAALAGQVTATMDASPAPAPPESTEYESAPAPVPADNSIPF